MTHNHLALLVLASTSSLFACGAAEQQPEQAEDDVTSARTQYLDISEYLLGEEAEKWFAAKQGLVNGFDQICGDTFCGGDFSNLYSLDVRCSVSSKIGKMRECLWTFAGSQERVDAKTGAIASSVGFFECRIKPTGNAKQLVSAFGEDPLRSAVPGLNGGTFYDQLGECFNTPIGFQPLPAPSEGAFADAGDVLEGDVAEAYSTASYAIKNEFDAICGDTFCEGDYTNLQSLSFRCSSNAGTLGACSWTFAGTEVSRLASGLHKEKGAPFVCKIPVVGTAAELAAALAPADNGTRLFERTLPGGGTLNDALGNCL